MSVCLPTGQPLHTAALVSDHLPSGQSSHVFDVEPTMLDDFPAWQDTHVAVPSALAHFPASQGTHGVEPPLVHSPGEQLVHVSELTAPVVSDHFPGEQTLHAMAPILSDHFPSGQLVHGEPNSANFPAGHTVHVFVVEPSALFDFPSGQSLHVDEGVSDHFPTGQGSHATAPAADHFPLGQSSHTSALVAPWSRVRHPASYFPAVQLVHAPESAVDHFPHAQESHAEVSDGSSNHKRPSPYLPAGLLELSPGVEYIPAEQIEHESTLPRLWIKLADVYLPPGHKKQCVLSPYSPG